MKSVLFFAYNKKDRHISFWIKRFNTPSLFVCMQVSLNKGNSLIWPSYIRSMLTVFQNFLCSPSILKASSYCTTAVIAENGPVSDCIHFFICVLAVNHLHVLVCITLFVCHFLRYYLFLSVPVLILICLILNILNPYHHWEIWLQWVTSFASIHLV